MGKYALKFNDIACQRMYEDLRKDGKKEREAIDETLARFREYDEGRPLSIFYKKGE